MMCRIALDADALLDHKDATRQDMNTHRTLTKTVAEYGLVEALGKNDADAIFDAIQQLDHQDMRDRWTEVLVALHNSNRLRVGGGDETVRELVNNDHLREDLHETLDLIVVSEAAATKRSVPALVGFAKRELEPELCVADSVAHCATVEHVQTLRERGNFPASTARETVWKAVFALPAELSMEATLLDQYFLKWLLNGRRDRDHAEWLIGALDRTMAPNSRLRLLCGVPTSGNPPQPLTEDDVEQAVMERIAPIVGRGRLTKVEVVLAPWPKRHENGPHNRHLRFSCGVAITTPEGFDRLDSQKIVGIDGFSWGVETSASMLGDLGKREDVILRHRDSRVFQAL